MNEDSSPTDKTISMFDVKKTRGTAQKWFLNKKDYEHDKQMCCVKQIFENNINKNDENLCNIMKQQIQQKINGYRSQDIQKSLYKDTDFVDFEHVLNLMMECQNVCYYCKNQVYVLYEIVREPKQWSLERIDNKIGHDRGNVVIACLNCNLRRKTMYHERFAFTKQLNIIKKH